MPGGVLASGSQDGVLGGDSGQHRGAIYSDITQNSAETGRVYARGQGGLAPEVLKRWQLKPVHAQGAGSASTNSKQ